MNSSEVELIRVSDTKYESGCYPSRVVMWKRENPLLDHAPYVTHIEVMPNLTLEKKPYFFILGHYDMTEDEALEDYEARCKIFGVDTMFTSGVK